MLTWAAASQDARNPAGGYSHLHKAFWRNVIIFPATMYDASADVRASEKVGELQRLASKTLVRYDGEQLLAASAIDVTGCASRGIVWAQ